MITLNEYQKFTASTAVYNKKHALFYLGLGLAGESGEVANKIKKVIRDNNGIVTPEIREAIIEELGDIEWYISEIATALGVNLGEIFDGNVKKISSRKNRNKLHGSGDNR